MRAINHALTGAIIGLSVNQPWLAIPAALASHYVVDSIPHFGIDQQADVERRWFVNLLLLDVLLCVLLVAVLFEVHHANWLLGAVCAFLATANDFLLIPRFYRAKFQHDTSMASKHWLIRAHDAIQIQIPLGVVSEILWFIGGTLLLWYKLTKGWN